MHSGIIKLLRSLSARPDKSMPEYESWVEQKGIIAFLNASVAMDQCALYASIGCTFLHTVLVPNNVIDSADHTDLLNWNGNAFSSWSIAERFGQNASVTIKPPLSTFSSEVIAQGEQLVFIRQFEGLEGHKTYYEISQRLTHVLDIHYMHERNAYCRLNELGDLLDIIKITEIDEPEGRGTIITIDRDSIVKYASLSAANIIRMFDITCFSPGDFSGLEGAAPEEVIRDNMLYYRKRLRQGVASYSRGVQIDRICTDAASHYLISDSRAKKYATFYANDWKNARIAEISCDPSQLSNYFVESDSPYEVSAAFFRAEVLLKYKVDPEKYLIKDRSISCRGAWSLKTYDINEAGGYIHI